MRKRSALILVVLLAAAFPMTGAGGTPVSGTDVTYTTDSDFDQGTLVNLNHTAPNTDQLRLNQSSGTFPFIWIALSVRCTIAKVNTTTGAILGEYRTVSDSAGCNQSSRTTVGLDGSVWVGHRGPGGVTHVGLAELSGCIDRNGNGTIETSSGYGDVKAWPGSTSLIADAVDECIIHHVDTNALGLSDSRHMSIDVNGKLWVGDYQGGHNFIRLNGATGVAETAAVSRPCGGYGGLIDGDGVIWSANGSGSGLLRWDPDAPDSATNPQCIPVNNYGLALDGNGWVWVTTLGSQLYKVSPDGATVLGPFSHGAGSAQGLAVDADGDVWVSSSLFCGGGGCTVGHVKNDGTFIGNVPNPTGAGSTGVSIDANGRPWTANLNSNTATRIDPEGGAVGADGVTKIGAVDLTVTFPAGPDGRPSPSPYNYSDMTGAQLLNSTSPQGTWTVTQDSGAAGTAWGQLNWNSEAAGALPAGSSITAEVRAAESEAGLGGLPFLPASNGLPFAAVGRFLQVRFTLQPSAGGATPVLSDVRIRNIVVSPPLGGAHLPAVARGGTTRLLRDTLTSGLPTLTVPFGASFQVPLMGDWDGNGTRTPGTFDNGTVTLRNLNLPGLPDTTFTFTGSGGGFPVVGDWDGDGTETIGVLRGNTWRLRNANSTGPADMVFAFGPSTARVPVVGDWDGDGDDTVGWWNNGSWNLRNANTSGPADLSFTYSPLGAYGYPVVGDWDGDGDHTVGQFRAGLWALRNTNDAGPADATFTFGRTGDHPMVWR